MKTIGGVQLLQKTYTYVPLREGPIKNTLGRLPKGFVILIYGGNGEGKTEGTMHIAVELTHAGLRCHWISYEQGHGPDLQEAYSRNVDKLPPGKHIKYSNPHGGRDAKMTMEQELEKEVAKKGSADVFIIDSIDAARFKGMFLFYLVKKYPSKSFILMSYKQNNEPKTITAKEIRGFGHYTLHVKKYIIYVEKSRFGGFADYVIFEERARLLNPMYPQWAHEYQQPVAPEAKPKKPRKPYTRKQKPGNDQIHTNI